MLLLKDSTICIFSTQFEWYIKKETFSCLNRALYKFWGVRNSEFPFALLFYFGYYISCGHDMPSAKPSKFYVLFLLYILFQTLSWSTFFFLFSFSVMVAKVWNFKVLRQEWFLSSTRTDVGGRGWAVIPPGSKNHFLFYKAFFIFFSA